MLKTTPHFITPEGEEVFGQNPPVDLDKISKIQNIRDFLYAEALKSGQPEEIEKMLSLSDEEIINFEEKLREKREKKAA